MPEPSRALLRPTTMKLAVVVSCAVLALASGCGDAGSGGAGGSGGSGTPSPTAAADKVGTCNADAPGVTKANDLTKADLDGDGTPETVKLTAPEGSCPGLVFAELGSGYVWAQVPTNGPPVSTASAVTVPGVKGQLVSTKQVHPRGGYQVRLYALAGEELKELTDGTAPLVPFAATDVQEHPVSLSCTQGGLVRTEAVAHEPRGVAFAWDVTRTAYTLGDGALTKGATDEVADNVLPGQLEEKFPELTANTMFAGCS